MDILDITRCRVDTIEERARRNEMTALHVFQSMNSLIDGLIHECDRLMVQRSQEVAFLKLELIEAADIISENTNLHPLAESMRGAAQPSPAITRQWYAAEGSGLLKRMNTKNGVVNENRDI